VSATITSIPVAAGVVVVTVAAVVSFKLRGATLSNDIRSARVGQGNVFTVEAFTLIAAVFIIVRATTVTIVPIASTIVVRWVAKSIADKI